MYYVYLLQCSDCSTYIGATIHLDRRLRQHNKEIKGGAHATTTKVNQGHTWKRVCYVKGFPNWQTALQFEWRWKQISRTITLPPLEKRIKALDQLLSLDRPTTKALPYCEWNPEIIYE